MSVLSQLGVGLLLVSVLAGKAAALSFFIDDSAGFNAAVSRLRFEGREDFESSTLPPDSLSFFEDPLEPGVAKGPFPNGTNPASGLTIQSNTRGNDPIVPSPRGAGEAALFTASPSFFGTPTHQLSSNQPNDGFDMIFGLPNTAAVSFIPLVYEVNVAANPGTATIRVFDSSNFFLGSADIDVASFTDADTFFGVFATPGEDIGRINVFATSVNGASFEEARLVAGADDIDVYTVPEASTWLLLGSGLMALGTCGWLKKRRVKNAPAIGGAASLNA